MLILLANMISVSSFQKEIIDFLNEKVYVFLKKKILRNVPRTFVKEFKNKNII